MYSRLDIHSETLYNPCAAVIALQLAALQSSTVICQQPFQQFPCCAKWAPTCGTYLFATQAVTKRMCRRPLTVHIGCAVHVQDIGRQA